MKREQLYFQFFIFSLKTEIFFWLLGHKKEILLLQEKNGVPAILIAKDNLPRKLKETAWYSSQ